MNLISQKELMEVLEYHPDTGHFYWKKSIHSRAKKGQRAGTLKTSGYRFIGLWHQRFREHRLAFLYMTGSMPEQVDHINHIRDDNRWCNLRAACYKSNGKNHPKTKRNTSGVVGVSQYADGRYRASIYTLGKHHRLGIFEDYFEAICARKSAEAKLGFHPNHGR